jgi:hypothetical protein
LRSTESGRTAAAPNRSDKKRNIVDAGVQRGFRVFTRLLGAIELANGLCANESGPKCLRFVVLLGAAFQLDQRLKLILPVVFFVIFLLLYWCFIR